MSMFDFRVPVGALLLAAARSSIAVNFVYPTLGALLLGALGWIANYDAPLIGLAALWGAAGVVFLLRNAEMYALFRTPRYKLRLKQITLGLEAKSPTDKGIKYVQVGMEFLNVAHFPISFIVDEFVFGVADRVKRPDADHGTNGGVIPPGQPAYHTEPRINIEGVEPNKLVDGVPRIEGRIKFRIKYGKEGSEKFIIEHAGKLILEYNQLPDGKYELKSASVKDEKKSS